MKICIGTAQLGMNYGIGSNFAKMKINEFSKILNFSFKNKVKYIDTASSYGESEKLIGKHLTQKKYRNYFKVISKIDKIRFIPKKLIYNHIEKQINNSLKNLNLSQLYAILLHDINDLNSNKINEIFKSLIKLKKKGLVKKIGFSAYSTKHLIKYIKKYKFDVVQFPFNVFDQRILDKKIQNFLRKKKIEVHIRSIFLQGLLLLPQKKIQKKFFAYSPKLSLWFENLKKYDLNPINVCLSFILKYKFFSKIVIGFDDFNQFEYVIKNYLVKKNKRININFANLKTSSKLINPSKW